MWIILFLVAFSLVGWILYFDREVLLKELKEDVSSVIPDLEKTSANLEVAAKAEIAAVVNKIKAHL